MGAVIPIRKVFDNRDEAEKRGAVIRRPRSPNLYIDFRYFGHRVLLSTGMPDTPENHRLCRGFLDKVTAEREAGTLEFAERFTHAPEHLKRLFARLEGRALSREPDKLTFGEYAKRWCAGVLAQDPSGTKRHDHERTLRSRILPHFKHMTFAEINGLVVKLFILQLCHKEGRKKGQQLAGSTIRNTLSVLRAVWYDACEECGWDLPDPFRYLARPNNRKVIPPRHHEAPQVFRYEEWSRFRGAVETHYLPITDLMVMTGMIASEIAALRPEDVQDGKILVRRSLTLGVEKESLKTDFRRREIPVTEEIGKRLAQAAPDAKGNYLFSMASGLPFDADNFRKNAWHRALQRAGLPYRVPYATRHTFAAWSLTVGMHPERLVRLMGHSTKKMVYETYGKYVEGLESDGELIRGYFGKDFK